MKYVHSFIFFALICLGFVFTDAVVHAEEETKDVILSGDVFWSKSNSPYIISDNIIIPAGLKLHINSGTIVKFNGGRLIVYGKLISYGSETEKVYFTHISDNSIGGDTEENGNTIIDNSSGPRIELYSTDEAEIAHTEVRYGAGVILKNTKAKIDTFEMYDSSHGLDLENSHVRGSGIKIKDVGFGGLVISENSTFSLENVDIVGVKEGDGIDVYSGSQLHIENATVANVLDGSGINIFDSPASSIKSLEISDTPASNAVGIHDSNVFLKKINIHDIPQWNALGIYDSQVELDESVISKTGGKAAIGAFDSTLTVTNTTIKDGKDYGIEFYGKGLSEGTFHLKNVSISNFENGGVLAYNTKGLIDNSEILNSQVGLEFHNSLFNITVSVISGNTIYGIKTSDKSSVEAQNNWWGNTSGPYHLLENPFGNSDKIIGNVTFKPWLLKDPRLPEGFSSVLFIPGLQASRLYAQDIILENQLWEPNRKKDVERLYLLENGESIESNVYTRDIIDETNILPELFFGQNIYKKFIQSLDELKGNNLIMEWKSFPYDWRMDVDKILERGVVDKNRNIYFDKEVAGGEDPYIIKLLRELANNSYNGKVTIIAHSNGGFIAKALIHKLEEEKQNGKNELIDKIDKVILVGVPQIGSTKAISSLLHGDEQELPKKLGIILDKPVARKLALNMRSGYNLLPLETYFKVTGNTVIEFDSNLMQSSLFKNLTDLEINTSPKLNSFLSGISAVRETPEFNNTDIPALLSPHTLEFTLNRERFFTNWKVPPHIEIKEIVGWGIDTVQKISYSLKTETKCTSDILYVCKEVERLDRNLIRNKEGDGTVSVESAGYLTTDPIYVNLYTHNKELLAGFRRNRSHADILEVGEVQNTISEIIQDKDVTYSTVIQNQKPNLAINSGWIRIGVFSPLTISATSEMGEYTGGMISTTTDMIGVREEIPNSFYDEYGGGKFVQVSEGEKYTFELDGYEYGTFDLEIVRSQNGEIKQTLIEGLSVNPKLKASIVVNDTLELDDLVLDINGDGVSDQNINVYQNVTPLQKLVLFRQTLAALSMKKSARKIIENKISEIENLIKRGKADKIEKRVNNFLRRFNYGRGEIKALDSEIKNMLSDNFDKFI